MSVYIAFLNFVMHNLTKFRFIKPVVVLDENSGDVVWGRVPFCDHNSLEEMQELKGSPVYLVESEAKKGTGENQRYYRLILWHDYENDVSKQEKEKPMRKCKYYILI